MLARDLGHLPRGFALWPVVVIAIGLALVLEALTSRPDDALDDPDDPTL